MRRYVLALLLSWVLAWSQAHRAAAAGVGVYGGAASGGIVQFWGEDISSRHAEVGLVLDTAVARRSVFNYRLQVGYDHLTAEEDGEAWDAGSEADLEGLVVDNTFGFRLFQRPQVRLWLGPQLRLARYRGHGEYPNGVGGKDRTELRLRTFGVGPALGVNWNLPQGPTLALTAGWRVTFYNGSEEAKGSSSGDWGHYDAFAEGLWFLQVSVLAPFGEAGTP